jgi:hypothetical protein
VTNENNFVLSPIPKICHRPLEFWTPRILLAQLEAEWIAALEKKAQEASSLTRKREEKYRQEMQQ